MRDLEAHAGVHRNTIAKAENDVGKHGHAVAQMLRTMEMAGVIFVEENGEGPGVRLRKAGRRIDDHSRPTGPATDAVERMEAEIAADRSKRKTKA